MLQATEHLEAPTEESIELINTVAKTQGLLIGPSSAAALFAALEKSRKLPAVSLLLFFPIPESVISEEHPWS